MNHLQKFFIFILSLTVVLAACGSKSEEQSADKSDDKDVRTIKHAMGTTEIKGEPKRVVTLFQGATDIAVAMGITPVGAVESWAEQPKYKYLRDDLKDTKIVGLESEPNLEEIAKLKPDIIIASKIRNEKVYDQLSKIAPTVTDETVFTFKKTIKLMGEALNKQDKAEELLKNYNDKVAQFQKDAKAKFGEKWPMTVSVVNFRSDHTRIYPGGYAGAILQDLGFKRNAAQQKLVDDKQDIVELTSKESIPTIDADHIFIFKSDAYSNEKDLIEKTMKDWTNDPNWKQLKAVKSGNVSDKTDEVIWNMAGGYQSALMLIDDVYEQLKIKK